MNKVVAMAPIMVRPNVNLYSVYYSSLGKSVKIVNNKLTAIQEHLLFHIKSPSFEDFFILATESNDFELKIMQSLLTEHEKFMLNKYL